MYKPHARPHEVRTWDREGTGNSSAGGFGHSVTVEDVRKLEENADDHAEGFQAGELKHGPLALVTSETPVLAA